MKCKLTSKNHNREHEFMFVYREHEILIVTPDGREIASLTVETSETSRMGAESKWINEPTNSWFLCFNPKNQLDKGAAFVQSLEDLEE
jgi:hypothetical protein